MSSIGKIRRLLHLLERLQSGRLHHTGELADFCNVSRRTIFRDIKALQDCGIDVLYDAEQQGYWIANPTYLPPTDLTLPETLSLMILAQEASQEERGVPFLNSARDAAMKLQSNLPSHLSQYVSEVTSAIHIHTEPQAKLPTAQAHFERLIEAITLKKKIRLTYDSLYEQSVIKTLLSPYRLLFRRHAWYVIGRSSMHRSVRTFHLGRIHCSELTQETFVPPPRFSLKRYFGNAWNMVREPSERTEVTVRFQPLVAKNVAEVMWHPTQKLKWNSDETLDYTVEVDGIHEISWWVLSYGDQARVLKPDSLQKLIADRARKMVAQYDSISADASNND